MGAEPAAETVGDVIDLPVLPIATTSTARSCWRRGCTCTTTIDPTPCAGRALPGRSTQQPTWELHLVAILGCGHVEDELANVLNTLVDVGHAL